MNNNEAILKKSKSIKTVDSSELSSDISDSNLDIILPETNNTNFIHNNIQSNTYEFSPLQKTNVKRQRFYFENIEGNNLYENITYNQSYIRKINNCLKKIAKSDLLNSVAKKFTFS